MATFATADDITGRLGRSLTDAETTQVATLLELATLLIAEAAGKDQDWADALTEIPGPLRLICIEAVFRVLQNPAGAASITETLGAYSYTERHDSQAATAVGLALTEPEERRVARAVWGTNSASALAQTAADDLGAGYPSTTGAFPSSPHGGAE